MKKRKGELGNLPSPFLAKRIKNMITISKEVLGL
jgi:hypothetical protein